MDGNVAVSFSGDSSHIIMSSYIHSSSSSGLNEHLCNLCKWEEIQEELGRETILTHTLLFDTRTRKRRYTSGSPTFSLPRYVLKNSARVTSCILVSVWRRSEQVHRHTGLSGDMNPDGKIVVFTTQNMFFLSLKHLVSLNIPRVRTVTFFSATTTLAP